MGIVIARSGENWRVDIGSAHPANLDGLAFEGASKRNRPNLKVCFALILYDYVFSFLYRLARCCTHESL